MASLIDIKEGRCGKSLYTCWQDILDEVGDMPARDMTKHITSRMTKTTHQDAPPHYYTHDIHLISALIVGLTKEMSPTLNAQWRAHDAATIAIVQKVKQEDITEDCNCIIEIPEDPTTITMWTRRALSTSSTPSHNPPRSKKED